MTTPVVDRDALVHALMGGGTGSGAVWTRDEAESLADAIDALLASGVVQNAATAEARRALTEEVAEALLARHDEFGWLAVKEMARTVRMVGSRPWCDTCKRAAVWSESFGWRHATQEHPFGDPAEQTDHEVTAREWNAT